MTDIYRPNNQEEISQFIYDCYELNRPIEIITLNSKPIGRSIQCSQTLDLSKNSGIIAVSYTHLTLPTNREV